MGTSMTFLDCSTSRARDGLGVFAPEVVERISMDAMWPTQELLVGNVDKFECCP